MSKGRSRTTITYTDEEEVKLLISRLVGWDCVWISSIEEKICVTWLLYAE